MSKVLVYSPSKPNPVKVDANSFFLDVATCVTFFVYFVERRVNRFQNNISNKLHNHSFSNIIFDKFLIHIMHT